jgi:hypothetical protein
VNVRPNIHSKKQGARDWAARFTLKQSGVLVGKQIVEAHCRATGLLDRQRSRGGTELIVSLMNANGLLAMIEGAFSLTWFETGNLETSSGIEDHRGGE